MKQKCHQCPWRFAAAPVEKEIAESWIAAHTGHPFPCHTQKYEFGRQPLCRGAIDFRNARKGPSFQSYGLLTSNG